MKSIFTITTLGLALSFSSLGSGVSPIESGIKREGS